MLEFEILARGLWRREQVKLDYQPEQRLPLTEEGATWIETRWQEKLKQARERGTPLYDAPLFRFVEISASSANELCLLVGETGYKEYVTTRDVGARGWVKGGWVLGGAHVWDGKPSNPLAVCSVVESSDGYLLLDLRRGVDVYEGRYHVIGGFFERGLDSDSAGQPDPFAAISREIREETGILAQDIASQRCLGLVYDLVMPHAELVFSTQVDLSLVQILSQRQPEDGEVQSLHPLQINVENLQDFLLRHHGAISATGEPNLLLYGAWKFGEVWLEKILSALM
jgi:hypothetical protein